MRGKPGPRALILAPTRELAVQIHKDAAALGSHLDFRLGLAFGGTDYDKQRDHLAAGVDVLIGTPGRTIDFFKQGVFAPLFGIPAATVTGTSRFARVGRAQVVPYTVTRLEGKGFYQVRVFPPIAEIPSGDELKDAVLVNQFVEARMRENPAQYMWVHRRFKTRPEGEEDVYGEAGIRRRRRRNKRKK